MTTRFLTLKCFVQVELWMNTKSQIMTDKSYLGRTNIQQVIQKHKTFEAELAANKKRLENAVLQGKHLVQDGHFASITIEKRIDGMQKMWNDLNLSCEERGVELHQISAKKAFDWFVEDFQEWISSFEKMLSSEDVGHDLNSVNILMKKQNLLETDIAAHGEKVQEISLKVQEFMETDHLQKHEIQKIGDEVIERYSRKVAKRFYWRLHPTILTPDENMFCWRIKFCFDNRIRQFLQSHLENFVGRLDVPT